MIWVGLYENKPKIYTGENGRASGIFVDILDEIARREKWQLNYVPCQWSECLAALEKGDLDLMPDVAFSPERSRNFDFHDESVIESWSQVYVKDIQSVNKLSDLNERRVALLKGSIQQLVLKQMMNGLGYTIYLVEAHSYEEAFALAANNTVDAVVSNHLFGNYYCQEYGLKSGAIIFNPVSLYFATAHDTNPDLLAAIDLRLLAMKSEPGSVYYKALAHWLERPPRVVVPQYLLWGIGGIGGLLALAFVAILLLRRQVRIRTRYLVQANETLRESEEKFRSIFQNHSAVKLIIDSDNGNIVEANEAAVHYYGWPEDQLLRMRIEDLKSHFPEPAKALKEEAEAGIRFELRQQLADGTPRDVEVFSSNIDIKGKNLFHYIIHDITEHRKLEEQYRQAQKMEAVGRLAGGVAHDYNNMLGVILGYTELALDQVDGSDPLHADLKEIYNAAKRSTEITRQLLAFARKQTISPKVIDLNESVENMLKMLRRLIGEDIDLTWIPESKLTHIKIDPAQIEQVLVNLCINARDAIDDVGKVVIESHMVTMDETYCADHADSAPGEFVLLAVSDDGRGMDKETLSNIFEPFFTTKDVNAGTGLGLATVYGIIKQNNGFINVYSEPGKGTTFSIYLPLQVGEAERVGEEIVAEIPLGHGELVLFVEDESAIRKMGCKMVESLGYRVVTAATPGGALRLAEERAGEIHLLITDVVMPDMNGRELADQLHSLYPEIKTLFMSGYTADVIAHRGVLEEGVHFMQKPFSKKGMGTKLREIFEDRGL